MKKSLLTFTIMAAVLLSACQSQENRVNIIKGPGNANNSLMVGFNELCEGTAEGFLGNSDTLLVSRKSPGGREFFTIHTVTKEKNVIFTGLIADSCAVEISPDGGQFICGNYLVDLESKKVRLLHDPGTAKEPGAAAYSNPPSYSFAGRNEVLLVDPFYYIKKYYSGDRKSYNMQNYSETNRLSFAYIGEKTQGPDLKGFNSLKLPEITHLSSPTFLPDEMKYIFIGFKQARRETPLYVLDLFLKKFILIDEDVKTYTLSPDKKTIAYIEKSSDRDTPLNRVFTANLEGEGKKELLTMYNMTGIEWSRNSNWIAYSGGEKGKSDAGIIQADGTGNEQLTHGMAAGAGLAWSHSGNRLAFTSGTEDTSPGPRVYIIALNMAGVGQITESPAAAALERKRTAAQLIEILRRETAKVGILSE